MDKQILSDENLRRLANITTDHFVGVKREMRALVSYSHKGVAYFPHETFTFDQKQAYDIARVVRNIARRLLDYDYRMR